MRIILVLTDPPLPFGNAASRWFYVLVRELVRRGFDLTVLAAAANADAIEKSRTLFPESQYDVRYFLPDQRRRLMDRVHSVARPFDYVYSKAMRCELQQQIRRGFDVLHLEHLWSGWLGWDVPERSVVNVHYLFDLDLRQPATRSTVENARRRSWLRAERKLLNRFPHISALTDTLSQRIRQIAPAANVMTTPLGFDVRNYRFAALAMNQPPRIGLIGSFDWTPSWLAGKRLLDRLWPQIQQSVPGVQLQVVGRNAATAFAKYARLPSVQIEENVPDIVPYFHNLDVMLYAPEFGSGMKVKVLEAMALGTAVVTNTNGVEGLPADNGVHVALGEADEALIEQTVALLNDNQRRRNQIHAARQLVQRHCNPLVTVDAMQRCYLKLERNACRQIA